MLKKTKKLKASSLKVFDVPIGDIEFDELNPNEMDEDTLDELIEGIREEGFDEPAIVIPHPDKPGKFLMSSGEHRCIAMKRMGESFIPCIIKEGWKEDQQKIALVRRNNLHGDIDPVKFTRLVDHLSKRYDKKLLTKLLGFTDEQKFNKLYQDVSSSLPPKQRKQLAKSKEKIKSIDDLSSVLNTIFKESGSELEKGYMVFSWGGKNHHYFKIDDKTNKHLKRLADQCEDNDLNLRDELQSIISNLDFTNRRIKRVRRNVRKKTNNKAQAQA